MVTTLSCIFISSVVYVVINAIKYYENIPVGLVTTIISFDNSILAFVEFCFGVVVFLILGIV